MALVNLSAAVNGLFPQTKEFGYNKTKETALTAALTSLATALTGDTTLTGPVAIANVKLAYFHVKMAVEAGQGRGDGSGHLGTNTGQNVISEPFHTLSAYTKAAAALVAPTV